MMNPKACLFFVLLSFATVAGWAQDPDIEADERAVLDEIYRSSDESGETPTGFGERQRRSGHKRVSVPRGAIRIGCICMDDSPSPAQSIGACSGHGGVRYWLYRTVEGDTTRVITGRHERHPQPLDSAERSEVVRKPPPPKPGSTAALMPVAYGPPQPPVVIVQPPSATLPIGWKEIAALVAVGSAFLFTLRLLLNWFVENPSFLRYALRHLLRHRQRPPARKNRKNTRKTRV